METTTLRSYPFGQNVWVSPLSRTSTQEVSHVLDLVKPYLRTKATSTDIVTPKRKVKPALDLSTTPGVTFALNQQNAYEVRSSIVRKTAVIHLHKKCGPLRRQVESIKSAVERYQLEGIFAALGACFGIATLLHRGGRSLAGPRRNAHVWLFTMAGFTSSLYCAVKYHRIGKRGWWRISDYELVEVTEKKTSKDDNGQKDAEAETEMEAFLIMKSYTDNGTILRLPALAGRIMLGTWTGVVILYAGRVLKGVLSAAVGGRRLVQ